MARVDFARAAQTGRVLKWAKSYIHSAVVA
jgi:hypothetical protein